MLLIVGGGLRRWHEIVVPFATVATWTTLIMLLPAFYGEIDTAGGTFWVWFSLHAVLLVLCIGALAMALQALRQPGENPI